MPFCVQCGTGVGDSDKYCAKCGAPQPNTTGAKTPPGYNASSRSSARPNSPDYMAGISNRNASLLCYIPMVGWIASIVVLASERFRKEPQVRFHAFQGLYLFVAWLMVDWVVRPVFSITDHAFSRMATGILQILLFAAWIIMLIKVSQDENYRLPIIGELADRSVSEQRS